MDMVAGHAMTGSGSANFETNKRRVVDGLRAITAADDESRLHRLRELFSADARLHLPHPINEFDGPSALDDRFFCPLRDSFPDIERAEIVVLSGEHAGVETVSTIGHYVGTFEKDWLGIPASYKVTQIRFGETHQVTDGYITQSYLLIDILDVMRQAGVWLLPISLGAEGLWLPPADGSGVNLDRVDRERGAHSLKTSREMQESLLSFDGTSLASMQQERYWSQNFMWFGPCGIGTTRGLHGFQAHHQIPFLVAFPDRQGGKHFVRMGDGAFAVTGGWPSVVATHTGNHWLGLGATGKPVSMRVMDVYRVVGDKIVENWVPIDMIHILLQLGYDVFGRLAHLRGVPQKHLPWEE
ncbi:MAG: ester cyclase [Pseudomonadota bacterium]